VCVSFSAQCERNHDIKGCQHEYHSLPVFCVGNENLWFAHHQISWSIVQFTFMHAAMFTCKKCLQNHRYWRHLDQIFDKLQLGYWFWGFKMAQSKLRPKIRNIRRAVKHTVTADHGSIDGDISAFVCLLAKWLTYTEMIDHQLSSPLSQCMAYKPTIY